METPDIPVYTLYVHRKSVSYCQFVITCVTKYFTFIFFFKIAHAINVNKIMSSNEVYTYNIAFNYDDYAILAKYLLVS